MGRRDTAPLAAKLDWSCRRSSLVITFALISVNISDGRVGYGLPSPAPAWMMGADIDQQWESAAMSIDARTF